MASDLGFRMHAERTPNPQSIKWVAGQRLSWRAPASPRTSASGRRRGGLAAGRAPLRRSPGVEVRVHRLPLRHRSPSAEDAGVDRTSRSRWWTRSSAFVGTGDGGALGPGLRGRHRQARVARPARWWTRIRRDPGRPRCGRRWPWTAVTWCSPGFHDGVVEVCLQGSCVRLPQLHRDAASFGHRSPSEGGGAGGGARRPGLYPSGRAGIPQSGRASWRPRPPSPEMRWRGVAALTPSASSSECPGARRRSHRRRGCCWGA